MNIPDHGLVSRDSDTDSGGDVIWTTMTEGLNELFAVPDGELSIKILECLRMSCFGEVGRQ